MAGAEQRIEAFFVAGSAQTVDGLLSVDHAWFQGLEVPHLPAWQSLHAVVVFDGRGGLPSSMNFDLFDPDGNAVPINNPGEAELELATAAPRYVFIYEPLTFEVEQPGPHRLFVRLDGNLVESAVYDLDVQVASK